MSSPVRISEAASLGLHTMIMLVARPSQPLPVAEAAQVLSVSENHLSKVLQRLGRAGLVESTRGPGGGFIITRDASQITLLEIFEAIEGPCSAASCLLGEPKCKGKCVLGDFVSRVHNEFTSLLSGTRLSDLAGVIERSPQNGA